MKRLYFTAILAVSLTHSVHASSFFNSLFKCCQEGQELENALETLHKESEISLSPVKKNSSENFSSLQSGSPSVAHSEDILQPSILDTKIVGSANFSTADQDTLKQKTEPSSIMDSSFEKPSDLRNYLSATTLGKRTYQEIDKSALMSHYKFEQAHTYDGYLFHGVKKKEHAVLIHNRYFYIGTVAQTHGIGFYTTDDVGISKGYTGAEGSILKMKVKAHSDLRILDLNTAESESLYGFIRNEADNCMSDYYDRDINEILRNEYGIDIIVPKSKDKIKGNKARYPVILNADVIDCIETLSDNEIEEIFNKQNKK